eukprot:UN25676
MGTHKVGLCEFQRNRQQWLLSHLNHLKISLQNEYLFHHVTYSSLLLQLH